MRKTITLVIGIFISAASFASQSNFESPKSYIESCVPPSMSCVQSCVLCPVSYVTSLTPTVTVYLIPGQGSDSRVFKNIQFEENIDTINIHYPVPFENESMKEYALRISKQIDTTKPFILIGVSLGGMIACELTDIIHPEKVIIISSASSSEEVPKMYTFFKTFPVYREISPNIFKYSSYFLQPLYEPDRKLEKETCVSMLHAKDPLFIKRAVHLIVSWDRTEADNLNKNIIHIHGDIDNTLPIDKIKADYIIKGGSHMMVLTKSGEISGIIENEIKK